MRGKGLVPSAFCSLYNADTVRYVFDAYNRLQVSQVRDVYTKEHIDGLGENFMRERVRQDALRAYLEYLERYVLDQIVQLVENDASLASQSPRELRRLLQGDMNREVSRVLNLPETFEELLKRYRQLEKDWFERVSHGLDRDTERGKQIFDDYVSAHPVDKEFTEWEKQRAEEKQRRLNTIMKTARPE